ncbi:MAG: hypothetical protein L0Z50_08205 [Verrucomicrobiales bacterium]|nr:hypothetical protein [Verrucomicrobiales bacterium]
MFAPTAAVVTVKFALVAPDATVTLGGTEAIDGLALLRLTTIPPLGAALVNVTVPCELFPPMTELGFTLIAERLGGAGAARGVKRRVDDQFPATPAEFRARTRHQCRTVDSPVTLVCDGIEVRLRTSGAEKLLLSST